MLFRGGKSVRFLWRRAEFCVWDTVLFSVKGLDLQNFATCPILPHRKHARVSGFLCKFFLFLVIFFLLLSFNLFLYGRKFVHDFFLSHLVGG